MPGQKYDEMSLRELEDKAREMGIPGHSGMKKEELIRALEGHDRGGGRGGSKS